MKKPRIFIGTPCGYHARYSAFHQSKDELDFAGLEVITPRSWWSPYISNNQNELARIFLRTTADYFWLLNDDLVLEPNTLRQLVSRQKDIIVPLVMDHEPPLQPLFFDRREGEQYFYRFIQKGESGLVQGIASGGGGMLISRRVFETVNDPWWDIHMIPEYTDNKGIVHPAHHSTEDFDFCEKAINAGFEIWMDLDASVSHITPFNVKAVRLRDGTWITILERNGQYLSMPMATPATPIDAQLVKTEDVEDERIHVP